jgi:hypothetical protein
MPVSVEISIKGKWTTVPALPIQGKNIVVRGKWIKTAIIDAEEWLETEVQDPELCLRELRQQRSTGLRADLFSFAQKLPSTTPKYKYHLEWDSVAVAPTSSFKEWWESLPQETRKNVRRAEKRGVVIEIKELDDRCLKDLVELNNDAPVRQGKAYYHYGKSLDQVRKDQESFPDRRALLFAYVGDTIVGFAKLVYRGDVAAILQFLPRASHQDKRPASALIARAVELCEAKHISHLTYGLYNYGNKRGDAVREFKIRNGFHEVLMPRYFVALTWKGKLALKLGFHRGLLGLLPHSLIIAGARVRAICFNIKRRLRSDKTLIGLQEAR